MTKKRPASRVSRGTSGAGKKTRRPTARKKSAARSRVRTSVVHLKDASQTKRAAVVADVNRVLRQHGIAGKLAELHLDSTGVRPLSSAAPTAGPRSIPAKLSAPLPAPPCGPGEIQRLVCFFRQGTFVCEERCV